MCLFFPFAPKSFDQPLDARRRAVLLGPIPDGLIKLVPTLPLVNEMEAISQWHRAGLPGRGCPVPFYNLALWIRCGGKPGWWAV
jgi:hypothetical protein